jgi:hypothetical protein
VTGREKLFLAINIVGKVRDHLASIVANGKLAQAELKKLAQVAERRRRFWIMCGAALLPLVDNAPILFLKSTEQERDCARSLTP